MHMSAVYDFDNLYDRLRRLGQEADCLYMKYCVQGGVPVFAERECPHYNQCPSKPWAASEPAKMR
jgi:hypothetical protein